VLNSVAIGFARAAWLEALSPPLAAATMLLTMLATSRCGRRVADRVQALSPMASFLTPCLPAFLAYVQVFELDDFLYRILVSAEAKAAFEEEASPRRMTCSPLTSSGGRDLVTRWGWVVCLVDVSFSSILYAVTATSSSVTFLQTKVSLTIPYWGVRCLVYALARQRVPTAGDAARLMR
jgi:hypothetical protein